MPDRDLPGDDLEEDLLRLSEEDRQFLHVSPQRRLADKRRLRDQYAADYWTHLDNLKLARIVHNSEAETQYKKLAQDAKTCARELSQDIRDLERDLEREAVTNGSYRLQESASLPPRRDPV